MSAVLTRAVSLQDQYLQTEPRDQLHSARHCRATAWKRGSSAGQRFLLSRLKDPADPEMDQASDGSADVNSMRRFLFLLATIMDNMRNSPRFQIFAEA